MFALLNSSKKKIIPILLLLKKENPTAEKKLFSIPLVDISNSVDEFRQLSI